MAASILVGDGRSLTVSSHLCQLIETLDRLGPQPCLASLLDLLERSPLTLEDVRPWVRPNPRRFSRARVIRREAYELRVMTWLPGQSGDPHDRGTSVEAMHVLAGTATQRTYQLARDGYLDPCLHLDLPAGSITGFHDAGIHSIDNRDEQMLVTLHVYAPPLNHFRRFKVRPQRAAPASASVCVIGGGYSGVITAVQLLREARRARRPLTVHLVEREGRLGEGAAYGTQDANHRLNVPARNMSAFADEPDHFLEWLQSQGLEALPSTYALRLHYGRYIRDILDAELSQSRWRDHDLVIHLDEARRVESRSPRGWQVHLARQESISADAVVLATGHRPPGDPLQHRWHGSRQRWIGNPWRPYVVTDIEPHEPVAVVGTGLSAIDIALSLCDQAMPQRTAPVWLLSRRGWLCGAHASNPLPPLDLGDAVSELMADPSLTTSRLLRWFRTLLKREDCRDWRQAIDGLRPFTNRIWAALPQPQRARWLRHLRPHWEVHRHRMAPEIAARIDQLIAAGLLRILPCRLDSASAIDQGVALTLRETRGERRERQLELGWVINCTGPAPIDRLSVDPLLDSLLRSGALQVDPLGLGLASTPDGRVLDAAGSIQNDLLVVGTLHKPLAWESTAVPELRQQAAVVARIAASVLSETILSETISPGEA